MTVSYSWIILPFFLILVLNFVQGTLTPSGNVSVDCGGTQTFACNAPDEPIEWTTSGLREIRRGPFLARTEALGNGRITSPDNGDTQYSVSRISISGFSKSDNGGTIQCINADSSNVRGMARISVDLLPLPPPTNVTATVESCDVTLQWDPPSEPNDITTSVSCTPPSPGCAECTTSPCTITGLNPSTDYVFTVTLNSGGCRASMNTTTARTFDLNVPSNLSAAVESCDNITLRWTQPSEPNDITTSVSCTPPSPGCAECTTSPCTITGLTPGTEYEFSVTLNSGGCTTSMNSTVVKTNGLDAPNNVVAEMVSCDTVVLVWTQPDEPEDITTSVSCTPPSPGCAECTTSPCNITGLNPSTEYIFTVTLSSSLCGTSMNKTEAFQIDASSCVASNNTSNDTSPNTPVESLPSSLAALVLIPVVLLFIYPLGVLIAKFCCFRDKSYCEVFWCCGCYRKDKSASFNSTELTKSPHPGEEVEYQNVKEGKHTRFVSDLEENKNRRGNKKEYVATYATVGELGDDDGDVITDETIEQQGYEDWIKYAALDFSGDRKGNINVLNPITDEATYTAV